MAELKHVDQMVRDPEHPLLPNQTWQSLGRRDQKNDVAGQVYFLMLVYQYLEGDHIPLVLMWGVYRY